VGLAVAERVQNAARHEPVTDPDGGARRILCASEKIFIKSPFSLSEARVIIQTSRVSVLAPLASDSAKLLPLTP
jgi:hypothetical protein